MHLNKIFLIAKREYWVNFRRRSFLFTAFVMPLITFGALALVFSLLNQTLEDVSSFKKVGIVDQAGIFTAPDGKLVITLPDPFVMIESEAQAAADLQSKALDAYYVVPADFMRAGSTIQSYQRRDLPLTDVIGDRLTTVVKEALLAPLDNPNLTKRVSNPLQDVKIFRTGVDQELDESALFGSFFVPFIFMMLVFSAIMTTSQFVLSGLAEEKENRMMEVFMTSARPTEMLWGKVLGLGALGLSQLLIWGLLSVVVGTAQGSFDLGRTLANYSIGPSYLLTLLLFFVLGYLFYGTLMGGLGALANAEQEGRQYAGIFSMIAISPIFFLVAFLENPNGAVPQFLSLFPFTSPIAMIVRMSWGTVPPEQFILSVALLMVGIVVVIWVSARLMRMGMLNYGKHLNLREIISGLIEGRRIITARDQHEPETA
jgi:ABC-2 type transport system permease protein